MNKWLRILLLAVFLFPLHQVNAQDTDPQQPVYIIQSGDNLTTIANRFNISVTDLMDANPTVSANFLSVGDELVIPGLEGISGVLDTVEVQFGDSLTSLSRQYQIPVATLIRLNHITTSAELYVGDNIIIPKAEQDAQTVQLAVTTLKTGQSLLEAALLHGTNPWILVTDNGLTNTVSAVPGEILYYPTQSTETAAQSNINPLIEKIEISPLPMVQGKTEKIIITTSSPIQFSGTLGDKTLNFFTDTDGRVIALQGIHAMAETGLTTLTLKGETQAGEKFSFSQSLRLISGDYIYDSPLTVDPETIDPAVTGPENELWTSITKDVTPVRYWDGAFVFPCSVATLEYCLETGDCWTSLFGNRRSYNGSAYDYFHTGLDIAGQTGMDIYAAASGVVVYANNLTVRGGATVINHGWGVYTAYEHQSEIQVEVGDKVEAGQVIGLVGDTGRVEGPHLHFEITVGGVQVDPQDWLRNIYP